MDTLVLVTVCILFVFLGGLLIWLIRRRRNLPAGLSADEKKVLSLLRTNYRRSYTLDQLESIFSQQIGSDISQVLNSLEAHVEKHKHGSFMSYKYRRTS